MKVRFLEIYNEEITDILSPEDNSSRPIEERIKKPVALMEDGKGFVMLRGLEEESVYSMNEIYTLLERGASKRRTVETLLPAEKQALSCVLILLLKFMLVEAIYMDVFWCSSSHLVFTITVYVKETVIGDEDLIKSGKLNLVDLTRSENILRFGACEVSEASRNMQDASVQQYKRLQLEMLNMQQVSKDTTKEVNEYVENSNSQFVKQIFS